MSNRIIIACIWWIMIFAAFVMVGCSQERNPAQGPAAFRAGDVDVQHDGLRIRRDAARNRIWLLGLDDVRVYDAESKRLIRKIALPSWSVARFICDPDVVLDSSGSAYISSNVHSRIWRIDADSFEVKEHEISLQGREQWDNGFGALAFAADGALYALTSSAGSLWKIDIAKASASMIAPDNPPSRACAFTTQFLKDIERSRKP
jgi:sugar lactone lactonase YvrE